jgi:transposase
MDMIGRIRRLHSRKNKSEREISRMTGLSRNTVAKWLHGEVDGPPKYRRGERANKLSAFHEALKQALTIDARRPKHERRTAKAYQFDWSEEGLVVGGIYYRMQVSHLKLCASRAFWLVAYPSQGHEMLFDAHTRSFAALGGVARRGIDDCHVDGG